MYNEFRNEIGNGLLNNVTIENDILYCPLNYDPPTNPLGIEYFRRMKENEDKIFQYIVDTDEVDTYGNFLKRCIRVALKIKSKNLQRDDVICICTTNHKDSCTPFIASTFLDIKVAHIDPSIVLSDIVHLVNQVNPKLYFILPRLVETFKEVLRQTGTESEIVVFGDNFDEYLEENEEEEDIFTPVEVDDIFDTALIFFSSGTTGTPKGIALHHYGVICQCYNSVYCGGVRTVTLSYTTLYWISGVIFLSGIIFSGTKKVTCSTFNPKQLWYLIPKYQISSIFLAPVQALAMLRVGRPDNIDTTCLLNVMTGGAPIGDNHMHDLRNLLPGTFIYQVYGQTEVSGILSFPNMYSVRDRLLLNYKLSSVGRPVPGMNYKIVDPETEQVCGVKQRGELRIKSKFIMNGYYNRDSSDAFDSDGWLCTGDIVYYDEDQCLYVVDRIKEMFKYKSWHVPPASLEQVINTHPAVGNSVVIGIPHPEDGDHPMALIILKDSKMDITPEDIIEYVAERVDDRLQLRAGVKFITQIPLTATGKMRRNYLRELYLSGKL